MSGTVMDLIDRGIQERVTVVHSGLKAFVRNNKECEVQYRISQEGVHFVSPHMTKRKFSVGVDDFRKCLGSGPSKTIKVEDFSEKFAAQARSLSLGSFVVLLEGFENDYIKKLCLVMWRCRSDHISAMVTQNELDGMVSKLRAVGVEQSAPSETKA